MLSPIFEKLVEKSPISVMARGMMERVLNPSQLDQWFNETAEQQYTKELMFSTVFQSHRFTTNSMVSRPTYLPNWYAMPHNR